VLEELIKLKLIFVFTVLLFVLPSSFADKGTFVDEITFIQYLDENTALQEVRNGKLDLYYFRVSSDRLEDTDSRKNLQIFESTGSYYSILTNPTDSGKFNPFSIKDVRFALNYLIDRNLIVNELLGGFGSPMVSNYGVFSADYLGILDVTESFQFTYNPALAEQIITEQLEKSGAQKINGAWSFNEEPIEITIFIRSDDPVRKSIGEILASKLESFGFTVKKDFGDLNKAYVIVYGSDPADQKWNLYTEAWSSTGFSRYDSISLAQMYAPWFSNMPGNNTPSYWNYQNDYLDSITQTIYSGNFETLEERTSLIKNATEEGINESVRIFLASKVDQYVANENVTGIINALGAGVPSRFTPINANSEDSSLVIGVKQIYQGAWNPVAGLGDIYSNQIWGILSDPGMYGHPFTGEVHPLRTTWNIETNGLHSSVPVHDDAMIWSTETQRWEKVETGSTAISKVTFDLNFSQWHNGQEMDMNDILYSIYFLSEWGSEKMINDKTYDSSFSPQAAQNADSLVGFRIVDANTIEVYTDYWHFDEGQIASWAGIWSTTPWELMVAMEKSVIDGKVAFSRSDAANKNISWLSLIIPQDAKIIQMILEDYKVSNNIPSALNQFETDTGYYENRYQQSIDWIDEKNHAVISNGPFYLDRYSPESRMIVVKSFDFGDYPFLPGKWNEFELIEFPKIVSIEIDKLLAKSSSHQIPIITANSSEIHYFISNSLGEIISEGKVPVDNDNSIVVLDEKTLSKLDTGSYTLKVFAASDEAMRPYEYSTSFLVSDTLTSLPHAEITTTLSESNQSDYSSLLIIVILILSAAVIFVVKARVKRGQKSIT
tara:strand:+ start:941 stop:3433 length:2493 start_codon:yes stop_codon:yes gene_type:complete